MGSKAKSEALSAVFSTAMAVRSTVTEAEASAEPSLEVETWAEFSTGESAGVAEVVPEVMFTDSGRSGHRVYIGDWSSDVCTSDLVPSWASMEKEVPASEGRGSDT